MGAGSVESKAGLAVHLYAATLSMTARAFYSADGDFLIGWTVGLKSIP